MCYLKGHRAELCEGNITSVYGYMLPKRLKGHCDSTWRFSRQNCTVSHSPKQFLSPLPQQGQILRSEPTRLSHTLAVEAIWHKAQTTTQQNYGLAVCWSHNLACQPSINWCYSVFLQGSGENFALSKFILSFKPYASLLTTYQCFPGSRL